VSDRALKWYFGSALVLVLLAVLFAWRPSAVLGVDGDALGHSVNGGGIFSGNYPCRQGVDDTWRCRVFDAGESTAYAYEVQADRWGCWEAERIGSPTAGGRAPRTISGCITLLDH
jgi:hypothetical protein